MNTRYLAYFVLLAGWLVFCYWLYAKEIYPRLHPERGQAWPVVNKQLKSPLAYAWGSDIPQAGQGFQTWTDEIMRADSLQDIIVIKSSFYRDERPNDAEGKKLGTRRAEKMIEYFQFDTSRVIVEITQANIKSDARSKVFEAVKIEIVDDAEIIKSNSDTMEICFPLKESLALPSFVMNTLNTWLANNELQGKTRIHLTGTADGSGIAESADVAWERAFFLKQHLMDQEWQESNLTIDTDQRNHSVPVRNRCVIIYFE